MNLADFLLENGDENAPVILMGDSICTYGQLKSHTSRIIEELRHHGVLPDDRVGLLATNSIFWVAAYLAILKLGATAVPFSTVALSEEIASQVRFAEVKTICFEKRLSKKFQDILQTSPNIIFDECLAASPKQSWSELLLEAQFDENRDAALMFTSGTTARPRAVRVNHHNIQANTESIIKYLELTKTDRIMVILPFYYCFGTSLLHTHLRVGGSLVLSNSFVFPELVLDSMESTHCTGFAGVPSTYQTLLRNSSFPKRHIQSLRKIQQAGGKLQDVLIKELIDAVPNGKVFVMYGQTEATARLSYLPPELLGSKLGSIGRGIPGVTLKVINEFGSEVLPGEVGEIYAWGDNISPGYLDDPETSCQRFVQGALHTNDMATVDQDGFIYVVDRKGDFIKSYGYRVSSQQIESCILEMQEVVASAVIGELDEIRGEAIIAFVVVRNGVNLSPEDILAHCNQHLARHMIPKEVVLIDHLPLNSNGKIMKTELRKMIGLVKNAV